MRALADQSTMPVLPWQFWVALIILAIVWAVTEWREAGRRLDDYLESHPDDTARGAVTTRQP